MYKKNCILYFERGSYLGGSLMYAIELIDGKFMLYERPYNDFCWMREMKYEISGKELEKLQKIIEPVSNWKKNYETNEDVDDGYGYSLIFRYKDFNLESHGYEKYPNDYWKVVRKLQKYIEQLGRKYNPNYQREGYSDRMKL